MPSFRAKAQARQNQHALLATSPKGGGLRGDNSPTRNWSAKETAEWKRANGHPAPAARILEPGFAGELDNEEVSYIWGHIAADLKIAHAWGIKSRQMRRSNVPREHIRMVAMYGGLG